MGAQPTKDKYNIHIISNSSHYWTWEIMNIACANKGEKEERTRSLYGSHSWSHWTWIDDKSFNTIHWHRHTPLSKLYFQYLCFIKIKSSSTWVIPASLCEWPFFYFYIESLSSYFVHQLREYSCHSEYNVHSPKIYYWLDYDYGIACSKIMCI